MTHTQARQLAGVNGVDLEYDITGQGEPVLLISPVLADGFLPLLSEQSLVSRYKLITYHRRGWMGSTHSPAPVTIADHAADAAALLTHLGIHRAHIVGHSSGAAVAAQLALIKPECVHTLALLELSLLSVPAGGAFFQKVGPAFEAYAARQPETALALFMSVVSGREWDACRTLIDSRIPGAVDAAVRDADTFFGVELPALGSWTFGATEASSISQPVLSVLGTNTQPLWVDVAAALRTWIPHIEECSIDGAGHLLHLERPEPVAQGLADFLGRYRIA
ncbi:MAG TPA: alpha/beta hydrolase [Vicinamibacterales bacterium]